jgi:hydrogenase expression/formation protein HypD
VTIPLRDRIKGVASKIRKEMENEDEIRIMHLCGTHEDTITRFNLRSLMPDNLKLISGPGCPVCIIPDTDLQRVFHLIQETDITLTTFGDMARVPFEGRSLFYYRAKGHDIRVVYSIFDALEIAKKNKKPVVHFGIGFETTMPSTALAILDGIENFSVLSSHRFFLPAMDHLASLGEIKIDGFINPGHVSTIVGVKAYENILKRHRVPQVIAGFDPDDVMLAIYMLVDMIKKGEKEILNEYPRAVSYEGNEKSQMVMKEVFEKEDWEWRGIGVVKESGGNIKDKYDQFNAIKVYEDVFESFSPKEDKRKRMCRCGEVLRGLITPDDCSLFLKGCTPKNPVGPCMVSFEGICSIWASRGVRR